MKSSPKPFVFCDMDGILADFCTGVFDLFERPDLHKLSTFAYGLHTVVGVSEQAFWGRIMEDPGFWERLPVYGHAHHLIDALIGTSNLFILTHPQPYEMCMVGKLRWLKKHFDIEQDQVIMTPYKSLLAGFGRLLIDDNPDQCHGWESALSSAGYNYNHHAYLWPTKHNGGVLVESKFQDFMGFYRQAYPFLTGLA